MNMNFQAIDLSRCAPLPWRVSYESTNPQNPWKRCECQCATEQDAQLCAKLASTLPGIQNVRVVKL